MYKVSASVQMYCGELNTQQPHIYPPLGGAGLHPWFQLGREHAFSLAHSQKAPLVSSCALSLSPSPALGNRPRYE